MPKVLIADKMDKLAAEIFQNNGIEIDIKPGLSPEELAAIADQYDGIAARSSAKITAAVIGAGVPRLKVIGRAGIGVDTIDVPAATEAGVIVMNTPFGNSITTAEHAIAMMFALARQIPQANESTHAGKWEKSKFMGVELYAKTLGIVGCGNIGSIVASRAKGLQMNVIAYDPFLTEGRAEEIGVEKVELDELFKRADFITLHVPKNDKTANLINRDAIAKMKKGVRIVNCARGGIIVEQDLKDALDSGQVAGAALDVFETEPATANVLFNHPNVVCTPHLGASTGEAQVNVAIQVAEQMSDYLNSGAVANAVNMPSISADEAPRLKPYMKLAEQLGSLLGQITDAAVQKIEVEYQGDAASLSGKPLTAMALASFLKTQVDSVNMVNAAQIAKSRGLSLSDTRTDECAFHTAIRLTAHTADGARSVTGTLFAGREPRIVEIEGVPAEITLSPSMLFIRNQDKPGLIGGLGTILGDAGQNIADFHLGRDRLGGTAICLVSLDAPVADELFRKIESLPQIKQVRRLAFVA